MKRLKHKLAIWLVIPIILIGSDIFITVYSYFVGALGIEYGLALSVAIALGVTLVVEIIVDDAIKNST